MSEIMGNASNEHAVMEVVSVQRYMAKVVLGPASRYDDESVTEVVKKMIENGVGEKMEVVGEELNYWIILHRGPATVDTVYSPVEEGLL